MNQFNTFFYCHMAKVVSRTVQVSFNMTPPLNIHHVFDVWLKEVDEKLKYKIFVETCTLLWVIWLCRNDVVFNNTKAVTPMQVIFSGTY